jgi:energy-coupling factor transporter ATP-binding protein EcfA2
MTAPLPRIGKIVLRDFRFFPGDETYTFELGDDGKNLLLFGENGSGKSSLFHGLRLLMSETAPPRPLADYRNIFTGGEEGTLAVELTAGMPQDVKWDYGEAHPAKSGETAFFNLARRATFLDYKALLRTNVFHEDADCVNIFPLLVETLLREVELPDGRTVSQHWHGLRAFKPREVPPPEPDGEPDTLPTAADQIDEVAKSFRDQLHEFLNVSAGGRMSLVERANALLAKLTTGLEITTQVGALQVCEVSKDPATHPHSFDRAEARLIASYAGRPIEHPAQFLNEARLTAMALALYLAAAQATTPRVGTTDLPRVLVLDDVLIGLDWANRLPVLKILNEEFADWQIILMTFDRVWFDLAKEYTEHTERWCYLTLRELPTLPDQPGRPVVEPCSSFLDRSEAHLRNGDLMAAAVYIRAAFETRLKNVCRDHSIKVPYKADPRDVKADHLWQEIVERQKSRQANGQIDFIDRTLMQEVETVRSTVLNRLSHSGVPSLTSAEMDEALRIIRKLQSHEFKKVH